MFMLPYSTELRLNSRPYVVYSIIMICFIVFYFQLENKKEINAVFDSFCESINEPERAVDYYDYMRSDKSSCAYFLKLLHYRSDPEHWLEFNVELFKDDYPVEELEKFAVYELKNYKQLISRVSNIPESLDTKLMYFPNTFNPFKMLTSTVSHADSSHIIFNLIFFFAFAPALEILCNNKLKFIGVLITIEIIGGVTYSIVSLINGENIPTLGLSGSVMGMIGFSAYLMPWARIRTLFVFLTFARKFSIPASFLAAWFIGWDVYDLFSRTENGGVNVLAHVMGGLTGYFMGVLFFKKEKDVGQHELDVEVDYMRSKRDSFSSVATMFKGDNAYIGNKLREHDAKKDFAKYNEELYRHVKAGNTSEALVLLVQKYDLFEDSPEIYIELFNDIGDWKKKRVYFCAGRLVIDLLVAKKKYGKLPSVIKFCLEQDPDFVLGDPDNLLFVVNQLIFYQEYHLAYELIRNAEDKYGEYVNSTDCILLEAKILWEFLDRADDAKVLIESKISGTALKDKKALEDFLVFISA